MFDTNPTLTGGTIGNFYCYKSLWVNPTTWLRWNQVVGLTHKYKQVKQITIGYGFQLLDFSFEILITAKATSNFENRYPIKPRLMHTRHIIHFQGYR